ncbi:hypothetical protein BDZ85DRAFT_65637 [Elsinoe ampelina]|uniref:Uncharacterized protein n=1 Tax=Elsinoe ampelina TaxID=302913 RepID=A0A6A6FZJ0_9PEZI|nr:hypothetical protein BDZ85DRAFT_65637 [Elsinoe ampelina]
MVQERSKTYLTVNEPEELRNKLPHRPDVAGNTIACERRDWLGGRYISCVRDMEELMSRKEEILSSNKLKICMVFQRLPL